MKIHHAEFVTSAFRNDDYPRDVYPEVAFAGRSNVGKSSLINTLMNRKNLARTSSAPGKTQSINFYLINEALYFVDLPGYGYAKVPQQTRSQWRAMIERYFTNRPSLRGVIVLTDARIGPTPLDVQLKEWLDDLRIPARYVATKVDKLSKNRLAQAIKNAAEQLSLNATQILPFSAVTGQGKKELWQQITELVSPAVGS